MPSKKLKLETSTDIFGTTIRLSLPDGTKSFTVGENVRYDLTSKLVKSMKTGYLFRSPNCDPESLRQIWDTIEGFTGKSCLTAEFDGKSDELMVHIRIEEKGDATMFAFSHNTFEKWSDAQEKEYRKDIKSKKDPINGKVNEDGTVRVTIDVETLGD
jgi:hypothetical protein